MDQVTKTIKELREEKQLSQEQLAEMLQVTGEEVANWENGTVQPDVATLTRIADTFEVPVEQLIYGREKGKRRFHFAVTFDPRKGVQDFVSLGAILAVVISYVKWGSIGWAILHGVLNWFYVLYYIIRY